MGPTGDDRWFGTILLPWVCQAGMICQTDCVQWQGHQCRRPNLRIFHIFSKHTKNCPASEPKSCPPEQESSALTKELASLILVLCLGRLLFI